MNEDRGLFQWSEQDIMGVKIRIVVVQMEKVKLLSRVQLFVTPFTAAHQASLWITNSQSLLKFHPLLSPALPAFNLSQQQGLFQ